MKITKKKLTDKFNLFALSQNEATTKLRAEEQNKLTYIVIDYCNLRKNYKLLRFNIYDRRQDYCYGIHTGSERMTASELYHYIDGLIAGVCVVKTPEISK